MSRQAQHRARLIQQGYKQKSFLLDPKTLKRLDNLTKAHGSAAEAIRYALKLADKS